MPDGIAARGSLIQMETSRDAAPTGTIAISGTAVTGTTTDFTADYTVGDLMVYTNTLGLPEGRIVKTITDGTNIVRGSHCYQSQFGSVRGWYRRPE
jgi:hypothetical protein